ncbi:ATP-grasp fold amidoligase family protein [Vibrio maritimus]|uniref:ATP-grasp fold amidoligase family protein n=1 Tax=Vibrio maritimus TaxID=990268 RepID=UPI0037352892
MKRKLTFKKGKYILRDTVRFLLGPKHYTWLRFVITHKYLPNFTSPRSFSEKIIARKFHSDSLLFSSFVDKYKVREYVSSTIGDRFLVPLIYHSTFLCLDDFELLPDSFVIKTSNGGGGEHVRVVINKEEEDLKVLADEFNRFLKMKVGTAVDEHFYDVEEPRIVIEELLLDSEGKCPDDFKIHVFNNSLETKVIIQIDEDRFQGHKRSLYDEGCNRLDFSIQGKYPEVGSGFEFPNNIDEMVKVAKRLSADFKYVRVDLYNVDGVIYFGELTFCHGSGWEPFSSKEYDFKIGSYWEWS